MVVAHAAAHFELPGLAFFLAVFPVEVEAGVLCGRQSVVAAPAARAAKAHVVGVVDGAESRDVRLVGEARYEDAARIAVLRTVGHVGVRDPRLVQGALGGQVEHGGLLAVVDARLFGIFALLVIGLDLADELRRQVFHGHLGVALEEVLAIDEKLRHGLSVPLDCAVVLHLDARQLLDERFDGRAFGRAVGRGVKDGGVFLLLHACGGGLHDGGPQFHLGAAQGDASQVERVAAFGRQLEQHVLCAEAHVAHAQVEASAVVGLDAKLAFGVGCGAGHQHGVVFHEAHRGIHDGLARFFVDHVSAQQVLLGVDTHRGRQKGQQEENSSFHLLGMDCFGGIGVPLGGGTRHL